MYNFRARVVMQAILIFAADESRSIPAGSHGGRLHIRYRLMDGTRPVPNATITESFTALEDPYSMATRLRTGGIRTDIRGNFDDYVAFSTPEVLPDDFRFLARQEMFTSGARIAWNRVLWSTSSVTVTTLDGRRPAMVRAGVVLR